MDVTAGPLLSPGSIGSRSPRRISTLFPPNSGPKRPLPLIRHPVSAALPFDLVTLGMGEDGHTASLFPGQVQSGHGTDAPHYGVPKPPPDRISLSARALSDARAIIILATGAGKRGPIAAWKAGEPLPVASIGGTGGVDVLIDQDANGA